MARELGANWNLKPFAHQREAVRQLLARPAFGLFLEQRTGKSACVVNAACELHAAGKITLCLVVAPAACKSVWLTDDPPGEIKKHSWRPARVLDIRNLGPGKRFKEVWANETGTNIGSSAVRDRAVSPGLGAATTLTWVVVSYEFLRRDENLKWLLKTLFDRDDKVFLAFDESTALANRAAQQTRACVTLAYSPTVVKRTILNGTPVTEGPMDLWSQLEVLDKSILGRRFKNFYAFRHRYAIMGGWQDKQVVDYQNLEELAATVAPHVIRVLKKDCLDLPPKLDPVPYEVPLEAATWRRYQELRRDCLLSMPDGDVRLEPNAAVRVLRLAQLTSGLVGGNFKVDLDDPQGELIEALPPTDLSDEKLRWAIDYLLGSTRARGVIVWCRFRRERERLKEMLLDRRVREFRVFELYGSQPKAEREATKAALKAPLAAGAPRTFLLGQQRAGGRGLELLFATEAVYLSNDFSYYWRAQSEDRCHGPGQAEAVGYADVLATGPRGEKTIDHAVVKALRKKEDMAAWTSERWKRELEET